MWNEIHNKNDLDNFMKKVADFHDSCIKEIKYISGAFVKENLSMFPENNKRILKMIIQRQFEDMPVIEMEFSGLKYNKNVSDRRKLYLRNIRCDFYIKGWIILLGRRGWINGKRF